MLGRVMAAVSIQRSRLFSGLYGIALTILAVTAGWSGWWSATWAIVAAIGALVAAILLLSKYVSEARRAK